MGHTAGKWETPGTDGNDRVVSALVKGKRRTIAHVYAPYCDHDESGEERDANARLIAAAPEMLELLRHIARGICLDQRQGTTCYCYRCKAEQVIAHADGRA